jgi:hypothetical protein
MQARFTTRLPMFLMTLTTSKDRAYLAVYTWKLTKSLCVEVHQERIAFASMSALFRVRIGPKPLGRQENSLRFVQVVVLEVIL